MSAELHDQLRGMAVRGVVRAVNDTGQVQTIDVQTHDGVVRQGVEVMMPYGLISHAPAIGSVALLIACCGDQGDYVALPVSQPSGRFAGAPGEVGISDGLGNRVHIQQGGIIDITSARSITLTVGGTTIAIGPDSVRITGPVMVDGVLGSTTGATGTLTTPTGLTVDVKDGVIPNIY